MKKKLLTLRVFCGNIVIPGTEYETCEVVEMTKKERATIQSFINKLTELRNIQEESLKTLQDINMKCGDGHRYCSCESNLLGILESTTADNQIKAEAKHQFRRSEEAHAQERLIHEFGAELANIGFWK